jgi:hypothetical protein
MRVLFRRDRCMARDRHAQTQQRCQHRSLGVHSSPHGIEAYHMVAPHVFVSHQAQLSRFIRASSRDA